MSTRTVISSVQNLKIGGDVREWNELIENHGKSIYSFCRNLARNQHDADDLYQETFLKAVEMGHRIDFDNNPKSFLISVAAGIWKNRNRKLLWRQNIAPTDSLDSDEKAERIPKAGRTPEDIVINRELCQMVRQASNELSDKLRIPLYMFYTAEMSIEEIASALKLPKGTVKSRLHKARQAVKHNLEVNYEEF